MRCNAGVSPEVLTDQHLIAEYRELLIPGGQLIKNNFEYKSNIPDILPLGKGHISFWRDKHLYLKKRFYKLKQEMLNRGFKPTMEFWDLTTFPKVLLNDYIPTAEDRNLLLGRIIERIKEKPEFYRYKREPIELGSYLALLTDNIRD